VVVLECADEHDEARSVVDAVMALDPGLHRRRTGIAVLARTHAHLALLRDRLTDAGVPVRTDQLPPAMHDLVAATARLDAPRLREWAHDALDGDDAAARRVAEAVIDYLREHPSGDGTGWRTWVTTTAPFGGGTDGIDLLTFHGAKGREWHAVVVTGVETGSVPHRSATTNTERAEERRLLYVALTRATDRLVVTWAARRGGYERRRSPYLDDLVVEVDEIAPPPAPAAPRDRTVDDRLERLHTWRAHAARAAGVLPDHLLDDDQLRILARRPPVDARGLAEATGIGAITATRLLPGILASLSSTGDQAGSTATGATSTTTGA
jgi:DNA helicase-2/ATP-dependent DNA helicase PcrA